MNGKPALANSTQPITGSGGAWAAIDAGMYTCTFTRTLITAADPALTTVVAMCASKDNQTVVANDVCIFVPAGGAPGVDALNTETKNRQSVNTAVDQELRRM
jgi:hypothetical protein